MSWSISTRDMARIRSFEDAKKHWESQPAWKNELTCWRPLSKPRETHKRIVRQNDGHSYACFLYDTALVTYHKDGGLSLRTYDTPSSILFANCVSPQGCDPLTHKGRMFWCVRTDEGTRYYSQSKDALVLKPTAKGNWLLVSKPDEHFEWAFDTKKGAELRKQLRPYADWYELTHRLGGLPHAGRRQPLSTGSGDVIFAREMVSNPESFMTLATRFGSPSDIRPALYEAYGARYKAQVPHTRLPKELA